MGGFLPILLESVDCLVVDFLAYPAQEVESGRRRTRAHADQTRAREGEGGQNPPRLAKVRRTCANTGEQQAEVRAKNRFQARSREGHAPRTVRGGCESVRGRASLHRQDVPGGV